MKITEQDKSRFLQKVIKRSPDECWSMKNQNPKYRPSFWLNGQNCSGHRIAWMIHNQQEISSGAIIMHTCDNGFCVNPYHLELGTQSDNIQDCVSKERHKSNFPAGECHKKAKHTWAQIQEIRRRHVPGLAGRGTQNSTTALAKEFSINKRTIQRLVKNQLWKKRS